MRRLMPGSGSRADRRDHFSRGMRQMTYGEITWITIGAAGQACFTGRMLIQWWASERRGKSVIPIAFWYLSLVGGVMMLAYAIWRRDPVFTFGQLTGVIVYVRNLALIKARNRTITETSRPSQTQAAISFSNNG